ncbi:MAG: hypothetical protein RL217_265 [Pseudomonadota bacterium]|jgi:uncharacterized protein YcgL (UPF0745 family)
MNKILCDVYKSPKKDEAYLYVKRQDALTRIPEALLEYFGKPKLALTMMLDEHKKLARTEASKVLDAIEKQGFFLQMPPVQETNKLDVFTRLDKE